MAEFSKTIGEIGEDIVNQFLNRIGWTNKLDNPDFRCLKPEAHRLEQSKPRSTHGMDFCFGHESPLFSRRYDAMLVSSKYSTKKYPASATKKVRRFFTDVDQGIECFRRSEPYNALKRGVRGIDSSLIRGLIFYINNQNDQPCLLSSLRDARMQDMRNFIGIIENKRFEFVWNSIDAAERFESLSLHSWAFAYHSTGHNLDANAIAGEGKFLPLELLLGGPLVFRISEVATGRRSMLICVQESFSEESLNSMIDLALEHSGRGWASAVRICFDSYDSIVDKAIVESVKGRYSDRTFSACVSVSGIDKNPLNIKR